MFLVDAVEAWGEVGVECMITKVIFFNFLFQLGAGVIEDIILRLWSL